MAKLILVYDSGKGLYPSPVIFKKDDNILKPVLFLKKAKCASQEEFDKVVNHIINRAKQ